MMLFLCGIPLATGVPTIGIDPEKREIEKIC
jgi:hypothetical protein